MVLTCFHNYIFELLTEPGGNDFTPIISCLSQLMMQPKYRTIEGFQRLIDKEWVALGHRFCERLGLISSKQKVRNCFCKDDDVNIFIIT